MASMAVRRFLSVFSAFAVIVGLALVSVQPAGAAAASITRATRSAPKASSGKAASHVNGAFVAVAKNGTSRFAAEVIFSSPDAPTSLLATPGNGSVSIAFTPGATGGDAITKYQYTTDSGLNWTDVTSGGASSPSSITGLTNGTEYSISLRAFNTLGGGTASAAVAVTPRTTPSAPTSLRALPGNGSASITFTAGATGGDAITKYQYQIGSGSWADVSSGGTSSPSRITGLTNGTEYSIKLRAINAAGFGAASTAVSVTPCTTPSAPTSLLATPGNGSVSIAFTAGATGGVSISRYQYQIGSGSWLDVSSGGTSSPSRITGLTNGTQYSIKLRAYNPVGGGTASTAVLVTPYTTPEAPTTLVATPGNGSISIAFTGGATGGNAITKYQFTKDNGLNWTDVTSGGTSSPVTITGLVNYADTSIKVRAYNAAGPGTESTAIVVRTKLGAPTLTAAYSASSSASPNRGILAAFTGVNPAGATMVSYRAYAYATGTNTPVSSCLVNARTRNCFILGLTNGVTYDVRVVGYLTLTGSPLVTRGTYESATRTVKV